MKKLMLIAAIVMMPLVSVAKEAVIEYKALTHRFMSDGTQISVACTGDREYYIPFRFYEAKPDANGKMYYEDVIVKCPKVLDKIEPSTEDLPDGNNALGPNGIVNDGRWNELKKDVDALIEEYRKK